MELLHVHIHSKFNTTRVLRSNKIIHVTSGYQHEICQSDLQINWN